MDFGGGAKHWDKCKLRTALEWVVFTSSRTARPELTKVLKNCVVLLYFLVEVSLFIERTDYRSNLAKTTLSKNCSCFSKRARFPIVCVDWFYEKAG